MYLTWTNIPPMILDMPGLKSIKITISAFLSHNLLMSVRHTPLVPGSSLCVNLLDVNSLYENSSWELYAELLLRDRRWQLRIERRGRSLHHQSKVIIQLLKVHQVL